MKNLFTLSIILMGLVQAVAQPDSETFPDFDLIDLDGDDQHLYSYLDEGKIVIIDIFTTWCPFCESSIPGVEDIWQAHGPSGDNTVMILSFERDPDTYDEVAFINEHNITNPVITGAEDLIADVWNIPYQPNYFVICPDRSYSLRVGGIGNNSSTLTDLFDNCQSIVSVQENYLSESITLLGNVIEDQVAVQYDKESTSQTRYMIHDSRGLLVAEGRLEQGFNGISVEDIANGMLYLRVFDEQVSETYKLIKK